jgi:(p)ppGpp synthase/HD superfamily hydrolase
LNKKQTLLITTATTLVGLAVGASTAGYRYFKNEENRERFLQNNTVQKLRTGSSQVLEQVKNGQVKLKTIVSQYKNDLEAADSNSQAEESNSSSTTNAQKDNSASIAVTNTQPIEAEIAPQAPPAPKATIANSITQEKSVSAKPKSVNTQAQGVRAQNK